LHERSFPVIFLTTENSDENAQPTTQSEVVDDVIELLLSHGFSIIYLPISFLVIESPFRYLSDSPFDVSYAPSTSSDGGIIAMRSSPWSRYFWQSLMRCHHLNGYIADSDARHDCFHKTHNIMKMMVKGGPLDPLLFASADSFFFRKESQSLGVYPYFIEVPSRELASLAGLNIFNKKSESCSPAEVSLFHENLPILGSHIQVTIRILLSASDYLIVPLLQNLSKSIYEGEDVNLEIAIDGLRSRASPAEREQWQSNVDNCEKFHWPHGRFLVTVQESQVGTPHLFFSLPNTNILTDYVVILKPPVSMSPVWYGYLKHLISYYHKNPDNYDPQLYGFSLASSELILGETPVQSTYASKISQFLTTFSVDDPSSTFLYRYPLVTTAFLFFPDHFADLVNWVKYMHDKYPNYLPCVPNLSTNNFSTDERVNNPTGNWERWVHRLVFERGW
jgi:hypothetical protein